MLLLLIKDMEAHTLVLCKTHMQRINGTQCDDLNYTILSNYTSYTVQLTLTVQQPFAKSNIRTTGFIHPTCLDINLNCSLGFALNNPGYCGCVPL